jgi:hypothetical protein
VKKLLKLDMFQLFLNNIHEYCDAPRPWGLYFQDSAAPQMEALVELHDNIMYYLITILFGVGWVMMSIIRNYASTKSPISHKYLNHGANVPIHSFSKKLLYVGGVVKRNNIPCQKSIYLAKFQYSTLTPLLLLPWWVTGFADAEAMFVVTVFNTSDLKTGWSIKPSFSIGLHERDRALLSSIQAYFGVGHIRSHKATNSVMYSVNSIK